MSEDKNRSRRRHAGTAAGSRIHIIRTDAALHRRMLSDLESVNRHCTAWLLENDPSYKPGWTTNNDLYK
jgi:hypothetical protein